MLNFNLASASDLQTITPESFIAKNPSKERQKIIDFITKQFKGKPSVSQEQLNLLWNNLEMRKVLSLVRFQIIDQKLYADSFDHKDVYYLPLKAFFNNLVKSYKIDDVDFIIFARDEIPSDQVPDKDLLKILTFMMYQDGENIYEKEKLLIPEGFMIKPDFYNLLDTVDKASKEHPWNTKIDKSYWRGAFTGPAPYTIERFDKIPRLTAVMLSKLYPDLIDALFIGYPNRHKSDKDLKKILDLLSISLHKKQRVPVEEHLKYKYLLSIDGNSCTGIRLPWIMFSNSVAVKQETPKIEWFYPALEPYVHYVPLNERLSNIFSQLEWMKSHDKELQQISNNAHNFVKNELMAEHLQAHAVIILNEYAKLQVDKKIIATLPMVK